jgi:hypothetical protein
MDPQTKWEMIKYKIRSFSLKYSKSLAKEKREKIQILENIVEQYENLPNSEHNVTLNQYNSSKIELENFLNEKTKGQILRSKVNWYEHSEKNSKFFLNLEKRNGSQNTIKLLANNDNPEHEQIETNSKDIQRAMIFIVEIHI